MFGLARSPDSADRPGFAGRSTRAGGRPQRQTDSGGATACGASLADTESILKASEGPSSESRWRRSISD
jgi:hypothetical protein